MDATVSKSTSPGRQWFAVLGGMLAWGADLLLRYGVSWTACVAGWAPSEVAGVGLLQIVLLLLTILTGAVALAALLTSWRIRRAVDAMQSNSSGQVEITPVARSRFMAQTGLLMNALFLLGILLQQVPGLFIPPCK